MDAKTKLMAARLKATKSYPYLSSALMALHPIKVQGLGTYAVDKHWRLYWDETQWDVDQMSEVLVHEVWHLLRKHCHRAETIFGVEASMSDVSDVRAKDVKKAEENEHD